MMKKLYKFVFLGILLLTFNVNAAVPHFGFDSKLYNTADRMDDLPPKVTSETNLAVDAPTPAAIHKDSEGSAPSLGKNSFVAPTVSFTSSADSNTCSSTPVSFTPTVTGTAPFTYSWNFGDGTPVSTLANPTHAFESLGCFSQTFNVTLTVTDATGSTSVTNAITVKQRPNIDFRILTILLRLLTTVEMHQLPRQHILSM